MPKQIHWSHIYTRPTRCQDFDLHALALLYGMRPRIVSELVYIPHKEKQEGWYRDDEFFTLTERLGKSLLRPSFNLEGHVRDFNNISTRYIRAASELGRISENTPLKKALIKYRSYYLAAYPFAQFIWIPMAITYWLENWFLSELKKSFSNWNMLYESVAIPSNPSQTNKLVEALLTWKLQGGSKEKFEKIYEKYNYLGSYSVSDPVWSRQELLNNVKGARNPRKILEEARLARKRARARAYRTFVILRAYPRMAKAAKLIHMYVWLRTARIDVYKLTMVRASKFYRRFEREFTLPSGWARDLTMQEIERAIQNGTLPSSSELKLRAKNEYAIHWRYGRQTKIINGHRNWKRYVSHVVHGFDASGSKDLVKGNTAYGGLVRGRARILLSTKKLHTMRKGEILIANMTHPDYLPAIRKSAAIVTDEGGIVCHAAIIARELKIPAVIGTKNATKTFKTGDRVEVDANTGVVRILS